MLRSPKAWAHVLLMTLLKMAEYPTTSMTERLQGPQEEQTQSLRILGVKTPNAIRSHTRKSPHRRTEEEFCKQHRVLYPRMP
jgi:hypothetical protein